MCATFFVERKVEAMPAMDPALPPACCGGKGEPSKQIHCASDSISNPSAIISGSTHITARCNKSFLFIFPFQLNVMTNAPAAIVRESLAMKLRVSPQKRTCAVHQRMSAMGQ
jgi:hypothetical protein